MKTEYLRHPIMDSSINDAHPCVLALGFFDGVHNGHQSILQHAKEIANQKNLTFGVMTFFPHPRDVFNPTQTPMKYLSPLPIKQEQFKKLGVEKLYIVQFTADFSQLTPEAFVQQYLIRLNCKHVVAGFDYHYGNKGYGNMETLKQEGWGTFDVTTVSKVALGEQKISSTAIRQLLAVGDVQSIPAYLGRYYEVQGKVEQASSYYSCDQFIKVIIDESYRLPTNGVYQVIVDMDGKQYEGKCLQMTSVNQQFYLLIQLRNCFSITNKNRLIVQWISFVISKQSDTHDMDTYFMKNEDMFESEKHSCCEYQIV